MDGWLGAGSKRRIPHGAAHVLSPLRRGIPSRPPLREGAPWRITGQRNSGEAVALLGAAQVAATGAQGHRAAATSTARCQVTGSFTDVHGASSRRWAAAAAPRPRPSHTLLGGLGDGFMKSITEEGLAGKKRL